MNFGNNPMPTDNTPIPKIWDKESDFSHIWTTFCQGKSEVKTLVLYLRHSPQLFKILRMCSMVENPSTIGGGSSNRLIVQSLPRESCWGEKVYLSNMILLQL